MTQTIRFGSNIDWQCKLRVHNKWFRTQGYFEVNCDLHRYSYFQRSMSSSARSMYSEGQWHALIDCYMAGTAGQWHAIIEWHVQGRQANDLFFYIRLLLLQIGLLFQLVYISSRNHRTSRLAPLCLYGAWTGCSCQSNLYVCVWSGRTGPLAW